MEGAGRMKSFPLTVATPDGVRFEGLAQEVIVRTVGGDLGFLAGHADCLAPLAMGRATVILDSGEKRFGACIGGMASVTGGHVRILATTFEWAGDIDVDRARRSEARAREDLAARRDVALAEARLKRALIRQNVAKQK